MSLYCKTMWSASKQKWWAWRGTMAWAWPSSVSTTVTTWRFPSHFIASSISDGVLYHVKCQYQCWPENRQRGPSVAKFCTSVLTSSVLASGHWPVPLKQLVQISVQKLIKEVFWSVEHQIIQQFSYLPKKVNTRALAVYIKKSGWPENWSGLYAAVPLSCISSCTTTSCISDTGTSMSRFNRCQIFSFENPHYCELCMFRTSNRSTLRILGGSSHPGLLRRRLTKWIHRELWIVNLHVPIKYWDITLLANQLQAATNSNIASGLKNLELVNLTPMNAQLWVQHTSSR